MGAGGLESIYSTHNGGGGLTFKTYKRASYTWGGVLLGWLEEGYIVFRIIIIAYFYPIHLFKKNVIDAVNFYNRPNMSLFAYLIIHQDL